MVTVLTDCTVKSYSRESSTYNKKRRLNRRCLEVRSWGETSDGKKLAG